MKKTYGYASVSAPHPNLDQQVERIHREYPDAIVFQDKYIATRIERPEWTRLQQMLKPGDTIVVDEISRMCPDAEEGFREYSILFDQGIELVFLKEPHINTAVYKKAMDMVRDGSADEATDTDTDAATAAVSKALRSVQRQQIESAFASAQRRGDFLHQRISEGIRRAQDSGKTVGRKSGSRIETRKAKEQKQVILQQSKGFGGSLSDADCIKLTGLARNTFYKYKRELRESML